MPRLCSRPRQRSLACSSFFTKRTSWMTGTRCAIEMSSRAFVTDSAIKVAWPVSPWKTTPRARMAWKRFKSAAAWTNTGISKEPGVRNTSIWAPGSSAAISRKAWSTRGWTKVSLNWLATIAYEKEVSVAVRGRSGKAFGMEGMFTIFDFSCNNNIALDGSRRVVARVFVLPRGQKKIRMTVCSPPK